MATQRDLHNEISVGNSIVPAAIKTTTSTGTGIDLAGYRSAAVVFVVGAITDGTHTPTLEESDSSGSGYSAVAAADMSGTLAALTASTNQEVSYIGSKRYIRAVVTVTGSPSTGGYYQAVVVRGNPITAPAT